MFKKSVVLLMVMVMLFSFTAGVFADADKEETGEGKAPKNKAGVRVLVDDNDKVKEIHFMDAVNDSAKEEEGNPKNADADHPTNPIMVAGN